MPNEHLNNLFEEMSLILQTRLTDVIKQETEIREALALLERTREILIKEHESDFTPEELDTRTLDESLEELREVAKAVDYSNDDDDLPF